MIVASHHCRVYMEDFTDYYTVLGVDTNAPASAIKTAFKKLALQYHPDVYKGMDAQERMRLLLLAYQTLNDPTTRKAYDAHRSEYVVTSPTSRSYSTTYPTGKKRRVPSDISPDARRDRQRYYDFPNLDGDTPVAIELQPGTISYSLPADQAHILKEEGKLRGVEEAISPPYICHRCHHMWTQEGEPACPACSARDWREYLLLRCVHCHAVFESEQIRYEVGTYEYGDGTLCPPYELFPLCPYCGAAGWCPAENARVGKLRASAARRAMLMRLAWISVAVIVVLIVGFVMVSGVR